MYLNTERQSMQTNQQVRSSGPDMVSRRAALVSGISGYEAQCRALSPQPSGRSRPHAAPSTPAGVTAQPTVKPVMSGIDTMSSMEPMVGPAESQAMTDAGLEDKDYAKARRALYQATIRKMRSGTCKRANEIIKKHPAISAHRFFHAYWAGKCWQYASALAYHAGLSTSSRGLMTQTGKAGRKARENGGRVGSMQTRSVAYRGLTLSQLGQCTDLSVGASIHVKVQFEKDAPYHRADDFHHWVTYLGGGKFTDSRYRSATGEKIDDFLKGWVRRKMHQRKYRHLHRAPYATNSRKGAKWKPIVGLQPRVTEVFMMPKRKGKSSKRPSSATP